jgi:hypothetical protein
MSQKFDEWKAAKSKRDAAKETLLHIVESTNDIVAVLESAASLMHGQPTQAMVPDPSNWPTKEDIKRAVQEFNAAHLAEWQKFESLLPDEKWTVSESRR